MSSSKKEETKETDGETPYYSNLKTTGLIPPKKKIESDDPEFVPLKERIKHQSFLNTLAHLRRNAALSASNGYPGVRPGDSERPNHLADIPEGFGTQVINVIQTAAEEVHEAQKGIGGDFLLEMTLTRTLSLLPSKQDINAVADGFLEMRKALSFLPQPTVQEPPKPSEENFPDEETPLVPTTTQEAKKQRKVPFSAYFQLLFAVTCLSSIGPFLDRLDGVSPPMRIVWRQHGTVLVLWPFALRSILVDGPPKLSIAQWCTFVCASFSYCVLTVAFSCSVDYTTVNDAAILTNSQSLLLVVAKLVFGQAVVFLEWSGVLVAFIGAYMCSRDSADAMSSTVDEDRPPWLSLFGDSLALLSAFGGLGYIMLGKRLREHVEVYVFMTINMLMGSTMILCYMWITNDPFSFDRDFYHGVFGWAHLAFDRLPVELCVVFICNICGTMGYVRAFKYFSSVIIAVAALLEPVTATLLAIILQVGVFPGVLGCIGNVMVIVGTLMVIYPSALEEEDDDGKDKKGEKVESDDSEDATMVLGKVEEKK